jgi:hypothetical protein
MKALGWIYRRLGQMLCFGSAPFALMASGSGYTEGGHVAAAVAFLGLLLGGVGLRAINVWKEAQPTP